MKREISIDEPLRENYLRAFLETPDPNEWETEIGLD